MKPDEFVPITLQPQEIETESFKMIDDEIGAHEFSELEYPIARRVIHATADFDLGKSMLFYPGAIESGIKAIRSGKNVVADVAMVQAGISKPRIHKYGGEVRVYISDEDVMAEAKKQNTTRAIISMQKAVKENDGAVFVIGNAPTALLELMRLVREENARPGLIIGVPVGFVSAAESKEILASLEIPFITNRGRKGGTPAAVAALNALTLLAQNLKVT
ncbi:MAG: precorrin-8X methylmutase [Leptospirales bacterium]